MNQNAEDIREHFQMVANEVPGSPIFIMQLMTGAPAASESTRVEF